MRYRQFNTGSDLTTNVYLADGSKVWLNGSSCCLYPAAFHKEHRTVSISGEAFVDAARNENAPFVVLVEDVRVETLGAVFHIFESEDEKRFTVVRGMIKIGYGKSFAIIPPRQQISLMADGIPTPVTGADILSTIHWVEGY